jgi:RNA polymerase sigma-70 factor (ECF subfamily)
MSTPYEEEHARAAIDGRRMETLSDVELARQLRERIPDAHAFVFREGARVVRSASYRILRSLDSVDDVVQRVFEELWRHPERYNPARGSLLQYLAMQGRSRSIDLVRSEIARVRRESAHEGARDSSAAGALDQTGELCSRLERLPTTEREAITLAYLGQLTYKEVALQLELPAGTVKSRIRKGLIRLRSEVSGEEHDGIVTVLVEP